MFTVSDLVRCSIQARVDVFQRQRQVLLNPLRLDMAVGLVDYDCDKGCSPWLLRADGNNTSKHLGCQCQELRICPNISPMLSSTELQPVQPTKHHRILQPSSCWMPRISKCFQVSGHFQTNPCVAKHHQLQLQQSHNLVARCWKLASQRLKRC